MQRLLDVLLQPGAVQERAVGGAQILHDVLAGLTQDAGVAARGIGLRVDGRQIDLRLDSVRRAAPISLAIVATALIDTGSLMDDVIAQEFKGTGNLEIVLDRRLADRRIFPALDIAKSGTRREDQLLTPAELKASHTMRRRVADLTPVEGTKLILSLFEKYPSNEALVRDLASE